MKRMVKVAAVALALVSFWHFLGRYATQGSCDSKEACAKAIERMCSGKGGTKKGTVTMTVKAGGGKDCSGDCGNGSIAVVQCGPAK